MFKYNTSLSASRSYNFINLRLATFLLHYTIAHFGSSKSNYTGFNMFKYIVQFLIILGYIGGGGNTLNEESKLLYSIYMSREKKQFHQLKENFTCNFEELPLAYPKLTFHK